MLGALSTDDSGVFITCSIIGRICSVIDDPVVRATKKLVQALADNFCTEEHGLRTQDNAQLVGHV